MIHEVVNLKEHFPMLKHDVMLTSYCPENYLEFSINKKRKVVLVLPGGGYAFLSDREAEPVALRFTGKNIATFVLKYNINEKLVYPAPYIEVFAALAYIRKMAEHYHIDVNKISVCGFSAGGHCAATSSAFCHKQEFADILNVSLDDIKINGCILGYPVISTTFGHEGTISTATKGDPKLMELLSIDKQITPNFPKTFIWHTTFDACVPLRNSLALAEALEDNKIFFEMHIYPMHDHGQSLSDSSVYNENYSQQFIDEIKHNTQWVDNAIHFVEHYI